MLYKAIATFTLIFVVCTVFTPAMAGQGEGFEDFKLTNTKGKVVDTAKLQVGKLLLLKIGATWCPPCREETKVFDRIREKFAKKDLAVAEVFVYEKPKVVEPHMKGHDFEDMLDITGTLVPKYDLEKKGIPLVMLVGLDGKIIIKHNSYIPYDPIAEEIQRALKQRG